MTTRKTHLRFGSLGFIILVSVGVWLAAQSFVSGYCASGMVFITEDSHTWFFTTVIARTLGTLLGLVLLSMMVHHTKKLRKYKNIANVSAVSIAFLCVGFAGLELIFPNLPTGVPYDTCAGPGWSGCYGLCFMF